MQEACPDLDYSRQADIDFDDDSPEEILDDDSIATAGGSCEGNCDSCLQDCCCTEDCSTFGDCCDDYKQICA